MTSASHNLQTVADAVARALVDTSVKGGSAFITLPVLYPSGAHSVVRIDGTGDRWFVSDDGSAQIEAETMGGLSTFKRIARPLAQRAGVEFDERCFFVLEVERDALPGAVTIISNISKQAAERTAFAVDERRIVLSRETFDRRLTKAFGAKAVAHNVIIVGASGKEWEVDAGVTDGGKVSRLFEFVTPRSASVAAAVMKFTDILATPRAPKSTAVLSDRARTEPALVTLLSRITGSAIDASADPSVYRDAA